MLKYKLFSFLMIITFTSAQDGSVGRRVPSFVGMRGKKNELEPEKEIPIIDFDVTDKLQDNSDEIRYHMTKRAHFGFQGTRGKKLTETPYKRVVGFTGTRGKKFDSYSYPKTEDLDDYWFITNVLAKRKFYNIRGKKLLFPFNLMGVRGKKGPSTSTFFGTRGKKDNGSVNQEDTNSAESLLSLLYLLANDKDYMKHNDVKEDADFEVTDIDLQNTQNQQLSTNDNSST